MQAAAVDYDVIIVGAGSAGCVLAARLSEAVTRSVLLLEAGPDYPTRDVLPAEIADGTDVPISHDWGFVASSPDAGEQPLLRGRLVGGSSAVNGTSALRGSADDPAWERIGDDRWAPDAILDGFKQLERDLDFGDEPWHGSDGPVPIRRYTPDEMGVTASSFLEAASVAGHPSTRDLNAPWALGVGPLPVNTVNGLRMSAAITHLEAARGRPNLTVRGGVVVDRVEIDGDRAVGVRLSDGQTIAAGLVVLSAGTYASPAILLRSGVGPTSELARHDVPVVLDLPGVGRNLEDHPRVSIDVPWVVEPRRRPVFQTMLTWASDGNDRFPDLDLFPAGPFPAEDGTDGGHVLALNVALVAPRSRGQLRLTGSDPHLAPDIDPGYLNESDDLEPLMAGVLEARRLLATEPLASQITGPPLTSDLATAGSDALRAAIRRGVQSYHHPVGTCRMGPDSDSAAVVDSDGFVHGLDSLVVADASVMPMAPRANTNLPTMLVAQSIADRLARAL